jgi:hypothetical protein
MEGSQLEDADEDNGLPQVDPNMLFSLRTPRDFFAGLSSGLKSIFKGVIFGALIAVVGPILGAISEGAKGLCKGCIGGLCGLVFLPLCGSLVGTVQILRGLRNTPQAIWNWIRGRHWDNTSREWVSWNPLMAVAVIQDEAPAVIGEEPQEGAAPDLDSSDHFAVLGVGRNVGPEDLRRQYYRLAREYHPDKKPDDPEAHARFQRLSRAYHVLSNPATRDAYVQHGEEGIQGPGEVDSGLIFTMLFGCDMFTEYVGELMMATAARLGASGPGSVAMQRAQMQRTQMLIAKLLER